jgi:hypothetical protein
MNSHFHPEMPCTPSSFRIAIAKRPPKALPERSKESVSATARESSSNRADSRLTELATSVEDRDASSELGLVIKGRKVEHLCRGKQRGVSARSEAAGAPGRS